MPDDMSAAWKLFDSLKRWKDLEDLIDNGEAEGIHLECKCPEGNRLVRGSEAHLAKTVSAFSNADGGVLIWGMHEERHPPSGLDVLKQICPVGNCKQFLRQLEVKTPGATTPGTMRCGHKIITKEKGDTCGVVLTYIPKALGDPHRSTKDQHFYFRSGERGVGSVIAPYSIIKRLFAATESPDLYLLGDDDYLKQNDAGQLRISIVIENMSSAVARDVPVQCVLVDPENWGNVTTEKLKDLSGINHGSRVFSVRSRPVIHRGVPIHMGVLIVREPQTTQGQPRRFVAKLFADKMRARMHVCEVTIGEEPTWLVEGPKHLY